MRFLKTMWLLVIGVLHAMRALTAERGDPRPRQFGLLRPRVLHEIASLGGGCLVPDPRTCLKASLSPKGGSGQGDPEQNVTSKQNVVIR